MARSMSVNTLSKMDRKRRVKSPPGRWRGDSPPCSLLPSRAAGRGPPEIPTRRRSDSSMSRYRPDRPIRPSPLGDGQAEDLPQRGHGSPSQALNPPVQVGPLPPLPGVRGVGVQAQGGVRGQVRLHRHPAPPEAVLPAVQRRHAVDPGGGAAAVRRRPSPRAPPGKTAPPSTAPHSRIPFVPAWAPRRLTLLFFSNQWPIRSTGRRSTWSSLSRGMAWRGRRMSPSAF